MGTRRVSRLRASSPFALAIVTLALFAGSLSAEFTYDDFPIVLEDPAVRDGYFLDLDWTSVARPARLLTLMLDHALFGDSPAGYHLHSLLWHVLSVVLLYFVLRKLCGSARLGFLGALVFAVHPIHVEAVTNVANRKEPLCMAFSLAAFLAYMRFVEAKGRERWTSLSLSVLAWVFAFYSKEVAIALPVSLVAYEWLFLPARKRFLLRQPLLLGAGVAAGCALVAWVLSVTDLGDLESSPTFHGYSGEPSAAAAALTSARAFFRYGELLVWPAELCPDHVMELSVSLAEPATAAAWLGLAGLGAVAVALRQRSALIAFGLLWLLVHYLPVSNLIPITYVVADRYMYVPSAGFCMLVVGAGELLWRRLGRGDRRWAGAIVVALAAVLVVGYGLRTLRYNRYWTNGVALWTYTLECNPRSAVGHYNLGHEYRRRGALEQAVHQYREVLRMTPADAAVHNNLGGTLALQGRHDAAIVHLREALRLEPDLSVAGYNLGAALEAEGRIAEAVDEYRRTLKADPGSALVQRALVRLVPRSARLASQPAP